MGAISRRVPRPGAVPWRRRAACAAALGGLAVHAGFGHAAPGAAALNSEQVDPLSPFVRTVPVTMRRQTPSMDFEARVTYAQPFTLPAGPAAGPGAGLPGAARAPRLGGGGVDGPLAVGGLMLPADALHVREMSANVTWMLPPWLPLGLNADLIHGLRLRSTDRSIEGPGPGRIVNVELDVWRRFGRWAVDVGTGYRWRTADDGFEARRGRYAFAGGSLRLRDTTRVEFYLDHREDMRAGDRAQRLVSLALSHAPDVHTRVQGFYSRDVALPARSAEIGVSVSRRF